MHQVVVSVNKVSFHYGRSELIVRNVSLRSFSSHILAIVGPSGCGKTTLIKLILSILPLASGSITLFGKERDDKNCDIPGPNVGYMPQDEALPADMMVKECLYFYAFLNKMNNGIAKRIDQILRDLELYDRRWSFILTLSGGMKRRLSLAIALLHQPKLLILDEPAVGADPLLRHKVWQILDHSRRNGQSIIVTTHYLDECRHADNILFMREGRKLAEASPNDIVSRLNVNSLDDAFLKLCSSSKYVKEPLVHRRFSNHQTTQRVPIRDKYSFLADFLVILAVCYRFAHCFLFNPVSLMCLISLSSLTLEIGNLVLHDRPDRVPVGFVVDNQTLFLDGNLLRQLNITPLCFVCIHPKYFKNHVDSKAINLVEYKNFEDAVQDIERGKIKAAIYFNDRFRDSFLMRLVSDQSALDKNTIRNSKVVFEADTVSKMLHSWIEAFLIDAFDRYTRESRANLNLKPVSLYPIEVKDSPVGHIKIEDHSSFDSLMFSLLMSSIMPISIALAGMMVMKELKDKSVQRFFSAGVSANFVFFAQTMVIAVLVSLSGYCGLVNGLSMRKLESRGSRLAGFGIIFSQCLVGTFLGQIIGLAFRSEILLVSCVLGYTTFSFSWQGFLTAVEAQPYYVQWMSSFMPSTLPLDSLKSLFLRELEIQNPKVFNGFIVGCAYILIFGLKSRKSFNKICN